MTRPSLSLALSSVLTATIQNEDRPALLTTLHRNQTGQTRRAAVPAPRRNRDGRDASTGQVIPLPRVIPMPRPAAEQPAPQPDPAA